MDFWQPERGMVSATLILLYSHTIRYQGEANVGQSAYYACAQSAMITDWRAKFNNSLAWFGFVELAAWPGGAGKRRSRGVSVCLVLAGTWSWQVPGHVDRPQREEGTCGTWKRVNV